MQKGERQQLSVFQEKILQMFFKITRALSYQMSLILLTLRTYCINRLKMDFYPMKSKMKNEHSIFWTSDPVDSFLCGNQLLLNH